MAEWQSSIRSYCDQGDDQWGIRPSTSRKSYLLVSLPDEQDIRFMPKFLFFPNSLDIATLFIIFITEVFKECMKYIYIGVYISGFNEVSRNFIIYKDIQRLNLFKTCLVVSSM